MMGIWVFHCNINGSFNTSWPQRGHSTPPHFLPGILAVLGASLRCVPSLLSPCPQKPPVLSHQRQTIHSPLNPALHADPCLAFSRVNLTSASSLRLHFWPSPLAPLYLSKTL